MHSRSDLEKGRAPRCWNGSTIFMIRAASQKRPLRGKAKKLIRPN